VTSAGRKTALVVLAVLLVVGMAVYVWPTAWLYSSGGVLTGDQIAPVQTRVGRFSGRVQYLTLEGFKNPTVAAPPAPVAPPAGAVTP